MRLFSDRAFNHIFKIKKQYEYQLVNEFNLEFGMTHSSYSPLMCLYGKWKELYAENLFEQFPEQKEFNCITDFKLLTNLEKILTASDSAVPLSEIVDKENSNVRFLNERDIFQNEKFENLMLSASKIIRQSDSILFKLYNEMVSYFFPVFHTSGEKNYFFSFSTYRMMNCIFIAPSDPNAKFPEIDYALHLVHELGHQVLYVWQTYDPLIIDPKARVAYSGVRKTNRPVLASLHAAVALAFMLKLGHSMLQSNLFIAAEHEYLLNKIAEFKMDLTQTLDSLLKRCSFTALGRSILTEMSSLVDKRNYLT